MSFYQIGAGRLIKAPGTPERLLEFSESDSVNIIHAANLRFNFKFVKAFFDLADPRSTWLARRITPVPPVIRPDSWFTSPACFGDGVPDSMTRERAIGTALQMSFDIPVLMENSNDSYNIFLYFVNSEMFSHVQYPLVSA